MSFRLGKKSAFPSVNPSELPSQMLERFHRLDSESGAAISRSEYLQLQALAQHYQGNERFASLSMPQVFRELDALKTISKLTPPPPSFLEAIEGSPLVVGLSKNSIANGIGGVFVAGMFLLVCGVMTIAKQVDRCDKAEKALKDLPSKKNELTPEQYAKEACRAEYELRDCSPQRRERSGLNASPAADAASFQERCGPYARDIYGDVHVQTW